MSRDDFRSRRRKLPPNAFLISPKQEPEPTDPVDQETWVDIVMLPDDVSLRTSDHHGTLLRNANQFWGHWIAMIMDIQSLLRDPREDALAHACIDASDDFQASIYAMLTGFYRQSIASLRTALEEILAGAYFRAFPDPVKFRQWLNGRRKGQLWVRNIRRKLKKHTPYSSFEKMEPPFMGKDGWVESLYSHLSAFIHGRPFYADERDNRIPTSNIGLWRGSNGPVYEPEAVYLWARYFFDTALLCLMLVGLSEEKLLCLENPEDISFAEFLKRTLSWHYNPHPVASEIGRFLINDEGTG